jgi:transcriptional regulator with XRE-family HTH domain
MSDEHKAKISESKKAKKLKAHNRKKIICNGIIYESQTELSKALGVAHQTVSRWLRGSRKPPKNISVSYHREQ